MHATDSEPHPTPLIEPRPQLYCQCGCTAPPGIVDALRNLERLLRRLDAAAGESGAKIHVTSGYRCRARNRAVGGTENSYHLAGRAFDFVAEIEGDTGPALLPPNRLIEWLRADLPPGGVGTYGDARRQNIVHYDTGPARSWGPHARRK